MSRLNAPFLVLFLMAGSLSYAQKPVVVWQKCLGGNNGDYAWSVEQTSDAGYIVAGYTEGQDNADVTGYHGNLSVGDIWIVKTDPVGNIQWQKCLGGTFFETGAWIHQTADGGYIVAGTEASVNCDIVGNHGGTDYWLIKLNSKGEILWQRTYGGSLNEYCWSMAMTGDGGYIMTGETESNDGDVTVNHGQRDYWVVKVDGSGNMQWQKSLGGSGMDESYNVQATPDGGCVVAGYTESNDNDVTGNHGQRDYWVVKLDNGGNLQWQKTLGGTLSETAWSLQLTTDGGYVVVGSASSNDGEVSGNHNGFGPGDADYWAVKLDGAGAIVWQKCYGGNKNEIAYHIASTKDGGFVMTGSAESADGDLTCNGGGGVTDLWTVKIDANGLMQWQKSLGGKLYEEGHCVQELNDGSFIIAATTCSSDVSGYHLPTGAGSCSDFWLVKLSAPLVTAPPPIVQIDPSSATICPGLPATLTASVSYAGINPVYQWKRNGVVIGNNSSTLTSPALVNNDNITCTITDGGNACEAPVLSATDAVTIRLNPNSINPVITISADNTFICGCSKVTFQAKVTGGGTFPIYQWTVNGKNTGVIIDRFYTSNLQAGDVVACSYTDKSGCIPGGAVISNSIIMKSGTPTTPGISITSSSDTICSGSNVTFTASPGNAGSNPTYQWKVNGNNTGTNNSVFTSGSLVNGDVVNCLITGDGSSPCSASGTAVSNSIKVVVNNKANPSVTISPAPATICNGMAGTFNALVTNGGTSPTYQWKINGVSTGPNASSFTTSSLLNGDIVNCAITIDPLYTCALSNNAISNNAVVSILNQALPSVTVTASGNDVCAGTPITFSADAQNAGNMPAYQWLINGSKINGNASALTVGNLSDGDELQCIVTPGGSACSLFPVSSNMVIAKIEPIPVISLYPTDTIIKVGQQVWFTAAVSGTNYSFQWEPADKLEDPSLLSPSTIHLTDSVRYRLTVTSDKQCITTITAIVKVGTPLVMPNAFTPNGDGVNEVFRIRSTVSIKLSEFSIFDRWGNRVFSTRKAGEGWDGTFRGNPAVAGTYVYIIKGTTEKGNVLLKGTVLLIR